jgi:nitrite reductase (cytochrome c-552)
MENRAKLEKMLVRAHVEAKKAWDLGATEAQMQEILMGIRHAQWRWDYAAASHGASFHASLELSRLIGTAIDIAQETRIELARLLAELGYNQEVPYPDISTKAKAQEFVGLPMEQLREEKEEFLKTLVPQWIEEAEKREASWNVSMSN